MRSWIALSSLLTTLAACSDGLSLVGGRHAAEDARDAHTPADVPDATAPTDVPDAAAPADAPDGSAAVTPRFALGGSYEVTHRFLGGESAITVVGDCDGDGRVDYLHRAHVFVQRVDGGFTPVLLDDIGGRKAGTMVDLDGDGHLDLVLAGEEVEWRRGDGACHFGPPQRVADATTGEPSQVLVYDVDQDGLADLTVGRQERTDIAWQLLVARGDGRFEDQLAVPTPTVPHREGPYRTFSTYYSDVDGDGTQDVFAAVDNDLGWFAWGVPGDAPKFAQDPEITRTLFPASPMSVSPIDYDRDGAPEYFVSGSFDHSLLFRYRGDRRMEDVAAQAGLSHIGGPTDDLWASLTFDANMDGYQDLLVLVAPDDHSGPGRARLLINQRNSTFALAESSVLGVDLHAVSMSCADFAQDGHVSCLARDLNDRGLVMLRNRVEHEGSWVGLRLRGTVSSPDASGARVSLDGAAPPLVVVADGQSPTQGEHDRGVLLAVGHQEVAAVTIDWPSGIRQRVTDLHAGAYATVTEPRAVTVSTRVAPADGHSTVEVMVDPAAVGAAVATIEGGAPGEWAGPPSTDERGCIHRTLRASSVRGSARVVVTLDGVALRVRPRVRFE